MAVQRPQQTRPKVLVTGAHGFIGRYLVSHLEEKGITVVSLSRHEGFDIRTEALPLDGVTHVCHLAGKTFVPDSWEDPASFYEVNALVTMRLLDQCRRRNVPVTYASAYVYGQPDSLPIAETAPLRPNNPYCFSKLAGEEACRFFAEQYGMKTFVLRLFNVYGPGQREEFLIAKIMRQMCDPTVETIEVADLTPRRDYVHVKDVARAFASTLDLTKPATFNVGSGVSHSVEDVIRAASAATGIRKPYRSMGQTRRNEIPDVVANIELIERECGWRPRIGLVEGLRSFVEDSR